MCVHALLTAEALRCLLLLLLLLQLLFGFGFEIWSTRNGLFFYYSSFIFFARMVLEGLSLFVFFRFFVYDFETKRKKKENNLFVCGQSCS